MTVLNFVRFGSLTGTDTNPNVTLAGAPSLGDLVVCYVSWNSTAVPSSSGSANLLTEISSTDEAIMAWRIAGAGESATQQLVVLGTARAWVCHIGVYSSPDSPTPIEVHGGNVDNDATKTLTTAVNPTDGIERLLVGGAFSNGGHTFSAEKFNGSTTGVNALGDAANGSSNSSAYWDMIQDPTVAGNYTCEAVASISQNGGVYLAIFKPAAATNFPPGLGPQLSMTHDMQAIAQTIGW